MKQILKNISKKKPTRGHGALERFLSLQRIKQAQHCLQKFLNRPRQSVLDIGCGQYPLFLLQSDFEEKVGIDQQKMDEKFSQGRFSYIQQDVSRQYLLPFMNQQFDAVTMLAVFEHFERKAISPILKEIYRVLQPGGVFMMTTPGYLTDSLLKILALMKLISSEEIDEHETNFRTSKIKRALMDAGFKEVHAGLFQLFFNRWFIGIKV